MLLEKQGRSSQRQRMQEPNESHQHHQQPRRAGSLPPSSLPRPPRSLKSQNSRYCRLSDSETRKNNSSSQNQSNGLVEPTMTTRDSGNCSSGGHLEYGRFEGVAAAAVNKVLRRKKSSENINKKHHLQYHDYERLGSREHQVRSLIPPPSRRINGVEYGRLSDGCATTTSTATGDSSSLNKQQRKSSRESTSSCSRGGSIMSIKSDNSSSTASLQPQTTIMLKPCTRSIPRPSNYRIQF